MPVHDVERLQMAETGISSRLAAKGASLDKAQQRRLRKRLRRTQRKRRRLTAAAARKGGKPATDEPKST